MLNFDNAIWDDDEFVGWDDINRQIQHQEWRGKYPNANLALVPMFEALLATAGEYHWATGKHLKVYGVSASCLGPLHLG